MKKIALSVVALGVVASSQAFVNFSLDNQYQTVNLPNSGFTTVTFTGTVDILSPTWDAVNGNGELPGLTVTGPYLGASFDAAFVTYINASLPGVDYTGAILTVTVNSTDATGNYFFNNSFTGSNLSEVLIEASDGTNNYIDNEAWGVTVNAVPEPASMAALGLGLLALARRRKA